jgi:ABC-2 type transport system permease protein
MATSAGVTPGIRQRPGVKVHQYHLPELALARFIATRSVRTGALWGAVIGAYVYASAVGYNDLGATAATRQQLLDSLSANDGLVALLGQTPRIDSVGVFVDWRVLGVWPLVVSVWAILLSTKSLRGEEGAGRLELFLSGPTTARRVVLNALGGMSAGLVAMFAVAAGTTAAAARGAGFSLSAGQVLMVAAVPTAGAAIFVAVGAVASQLMATRARAAGLAAGVFGVAFMLRALGDAAPAAHALVYGSPLGWLEKVQPLGAPRPVWLLLALVLVAVLAAVAVVLAERDLGASTIGHSDQAQARTALLGSPLGLALRLTRGSLAVWLSASAVAGLLYGSFAESAGKAFASSSIVDKLGGDLFSRAQHVGSRIYAGVVFLMLMTLVMAYVASAMSNVREQEADGLLDNLLVRSVRRESWLAGRVLIVTGTVCAAGVLASLAFWAGASSQHSALTLRELVLAGVNAAAPGLALLGIAVFVYGFLPRWTSRVGYGLLAWAFLLEMLGSAVHINHWVMDTSLLHHVALAPVTDPDWRVVGTYLVGGIAMAFAGGWRFSTRDMAAE